MRESPAEGFGIAEHVARSFRVVWITVIVVILANTVGFFAAVAVYEAKHERYREGLVALGLSNEGMLNQSVGIRGYLLAQDPEFLEAYRLGKQQMRDGNARLAELLADEPQLAERLLEVRVAQQRWVDERARAVVSAGARSLSDREKLRSTRLGKTLLDAYRVKEAALSRQIEARIEQTSRAQRLLLGAFAAGSLIVLLVALALVSRQRRKLNRAIVDPVQELLTSMQRMQAGDLDVRIAASGPLELRSIMSGLQEMSLALSESSARSRSRYAETVEQATGLGRLLKLSREFTSTLDLDHVLEAVGSSAAELSGLSETTVWLLDGSGHQLAIAYRHGSGTRLDDPVTVGEGVVGKAAGSGRITVAQADGGEQSRVVALPLIVSGRSIGVVELNGIAPDGMSETIEQLLETFASTAAAAIEAARLHKRTEELSQRDSLTGLLNRRRFGEDVAREFHRSSRYQTPLSFVLLDVDHFKEFNDTHGHQKGDVILQEAAASLAAGVRASDSVFRYGGEEFAMLMPETPLAGATLIAERLRSDLSRGLSLVAGGVLVTASFGVTQRSDDMMTPDDLIRTADEALYRAKREGRNRTRVAGEAVRQAVTIPSG